MFELCKVMFYLEIKKKYKNEQNGWKFFFP